MCLPCTRTSFPEVFPVIGWTIDTLAISGIYNGREGPTGSRTSTRFPQILSQVICTEEKGFEACD